MRGAPTKPSSSLSVAHSSVAATPSTTTASALGGMSAARARGGQLVVENVSLLAGGPDAFEERYGVSLTDDAFKRPGNSAVAHPLLHFLLCAIDPDDAPGAFKPCFPIRDRDQERDFKRIVDARLALLERGKLIAPGVARKSVVASAGGDKFEQLVWTLSTVALQQAALRHPSHATVHALVPNPPVQTGADGQNRRYAALLRARIASERSAFARTSQMARDATQRWTDEVKQLRDRISSFDAKADALRKELAELGFDERGVDLRARQTEALVQELEATMENAEAAKEVQAQLLGAAGVQAGTEESEGTQAAASSSSAVKTSPIDSVESASVEDAFPGMDDETDVLLDADELSDNLTRLLAFGIGPGGHEQEAIEALNAAKGRSDCAAASSGSAELGSKISTKSAAMIQEGGGSGDSEDGEPCEDVADLILSAVEELGKATLRLKTIAQQKEHVVSSTVTTPSPVLAGSEKPKHDLASTIENSVTLHRTVITSAKELATKASDVSKDAERKVKELEKEEQERRALIEEETSDLTESFISLSRMSSSLPSETPPAWVTDVNSVDVIDEFDDTELYESDSTSKLKDTLAKKSILTDVLQTSATSTSGSASGSTDELTGATVRSRVDFFETVEELRTTTKAISALRQPPPVSKEAKPKKSTLRKRVANLAGRSTDFDNEKRPFHKVPLPKNPKRRTGKTVRFAELPPSYTASKNSEGSKKPLQEPPPEVTNIPLDDADDDPMPGGAISALLARQRYEKREVQSRVSLSADFLDFSPSSRDNDEMETTGKDKNKDGKAKDPRHRDSISFPSPGTGMFRHKALQRRPTPRRLAKRAGGIRSSRVDSSISEIPQFSVQLQQSPGTSAARSPSSPGQSPRKGSAGNPMHGSDANIVSETCASSSLHPSSLVDSTESASEPIVGSSPSAFGRSGAVDVEFSDECSITSTSENATRRALSASGLGTSSKRPSPVQRLVSFPSPFGRREAKTSILLSSTDDDNNMFPMANDESASARRKSSYRHNSSTSPFSSNGLRSKSPRGPSASSRLSAMLSRRNTSGPGQSLFGGDKSKESGSPPGKTSRVKSLRARLAALL